MVHSLSRSVSFTKKYSFKVYAVGLMACRQWILHKRQVLLLLALLLFHKCSIFQGLRKGDHAFFWSPVGPVGWSPCSISTLSLPTFWWHLFHFLFAQSIPFPFLNWQLCENRDSFCLVPYSIPSTTSVPGRWQDHHQRLQSEWKASVVTWAEETRRYSSTALENE